jgi:uncharacterized protein with von Willebrand factor type A (vWA) domain
MIAGHPAGGTLADNVMRFGRLLRAAGLPIGPDRILDALCAARIAGVERRDDFYWALAAVLISRRDQLELYDQAFRIFWRDPVLAPPFQPLPEARGRIAARHDEPALSARLAQALEPRRESPVGTRNALETGFAASPREALRTMDFESMTREEYDAARAAVAALRPRLPEVRTRRMRADARGPRVDPRASLRASARNGGEALLLRHRAPVRRTLPLVALCDISGSMSRYTRMFLHLLHALASGPQRVSAFTFGTRLTPVTRALHGRDPDAALERVSRAVKDWSGGTRIGACLREFNVRWSRRLLGQGAVVLLISDGLDCGPSAELAREMERLHKSCRALIWLNPLLRYARFEPKALGIRAMLPHVDALLPAHNLASLEQLATMLEEQTAFSKRKGR